MLLSKTSIVRSLDEREFPHIPSRTSLVSRLAPMPYRGLVSSIWLALQFHKQYTELSPQISQISVRLHWLIEFIFTFSIGGRLSESSLCSWRADPQNPTLEPYQ